jgi:hypothetical protein
VPKVKAVAPGNVVLNSQGVSRMVLLHAGKQFGNMLKVFEQQVPYKIVIEHA